jgi:uncharacterized repeat protein (TIGR01451 family)
VIKRILLLLGMTFSFHALFATGEPSTYFQIFVPPNNDAVRRDAALIITAIYDSTAFEIIDDGMDGDTDDSKTGILMAGQSYVLYIRDNGINDDARYASGGVLKWDGDYFIVKSNNLVFASQSTNSDWQHDWVPSTDKKSIGQKFIIYSPPFTSSKRDINVMAYENNTTVTFQKISWQPKTNTGFTDVKMEEPTQVFTRTLNIGEDLIYKYTDGRDVMAAGETYLLLSDKPVTVQYGALFGNERDGGGYVPSSNGSSSGELLYFTVPYQSIGEQEIRIVSWDDKNDIKLERFENNKWIELRNYSLNKMQAGDWVGRNFNNASFNTVFRITCTTGKKVSVFEGNWFETGAPGTSDMGTMVSAENGTTSGTRFLTYMAPPGNENNVINPFTGKAFGTRLSHLYIFAKEGATVTVSDAYSQGKTFKRSFTIGAEKYVDCFITEAEWRSIYNKTGTASGPERPYLLVETDKAVSVMNTNFNDNWMLYTGSSLTQAFTQNSATTQSTAIPGDVVTITSTITTGSQVDNPTIEVIVQDGLKLVASTLTNDKKEKSDGHIEEQSSKTVVTFDSVGKLEEGKKYTVETKVTAELGTNNGTVITNNTNATVETIVTGSVGGQTQQSSNTQVVYVNPSNTSKLIFSKSDNKLINSDSTDSWTASWADLNNDGFDDLFVPDRRLTHPNRVYINNQKGGFDRLTGTPLTSDLAATISNSIVDIDNDGDLDVLAVNNTRHPNFFYRNNEGKFVRDNTQAFAQTISYYHGAAFSDYDNDGNPDLFLCNYFPTKYNELYHNNGKGNFSKEIADVIPSEANQSVGPTWADYDNDGFADLFVPNGSGFKNSLFHNEGNGNFVKANNAVTNDGGQSVGSCWGDIDNDGDLDLFVTNANNTGNFLYFNEGNGKFRKITNGAVATDKGASHGCSFADMDNDGDLDLYVTNDKSYKFLYLNDGKGNFARKTDELIAYDFGKSFGHVWSDYDHDGDLDLYVATHSNQPNALFTNNGNDNQWLSVTLQGSDCNYSAIGARIYVKSSGIWQMREINAQSGFGGQNSLTQHFGLGDATTVDSLKILWPCGHEEVFEKVKASQRMTIKESSSTTIVAGIYHDENGNCVKDANEPTIPRAVAAIAGKTGKFFSNHAGLISMNLAKGTYHLQVLDEKDVKSTACKNFIVEVNDSLKNDTAWLAATPVCNGSNLWLVMGSTAIRKGMNNNQFTITANNTGRQTAHKVWLKWKLPASITPGTPSQPFAQVASLNENGIAYKEYSWVVPALAPFSSYTITLMHGNDANVKIGDVIAMSGWIESDGVDCKADRNALVQTYKVVGAIDPNDMLVSPVGYGPEGFILPSQVLTYTIRFQNLGNHPASDVHIVDELPEELDLATLQLVSASHDNLQMNLLGRTLQFNFTGIYLPDSTSNEEGSNGQVTFSISPKQGIRAGAMLKNKASIQFDHYEPMITNEVLNTIQSAQQEQQQIVVKSYPNPVMDVLYLSLEHKMGSKYTKKLIRQVAFVDLSGRTILSQAFTAKDELRINIPPFLNGFYLLKITDNSGMLYIHKIFIGKPR